MSHVWTHAFGRSEWMRLGGFGAIIAVLHAAGLGLFVWYSRDYPALVGLGTLAYGFGLRHAFDADHIAAIDNTTRSLIQRGHKPVGVGFFFSLGHSTVVFLLATGLAVAAAWMNARLPLLRQYGGTVGTSVSVLFLWAIGVLNLSVLIGLVRAYRGLKAGTHDESHVDALLTQGGLVGRLLGSRVFTFIRHSWHAYPLGFLFGLGFDTATEIGMLALAAGVATHDLPVAAVMSLPLLFAAGMCLMDTLDGAFMAKAYGWALSYPLRKIHYNVVITGLSVSVALGVGTIELLQLVSTRMAWHTPFWIRVQTLDFGTAGYVIVGVFLAAWGIAWLAWKLLRGGDTKPGLATPPA